MVSEPLVAAVPSRHRLADKSSIPVSALANEPFVLPPRDAVPFFHDRVLKACREAGFLPHAPYEADHLQLILGMVAAGAGIALIPAAAHKIRPHGVAYRRLHPSPENLETAVAWRKDDTSPLVAEFLHEARRILRSVSKGPHR
jgi:DNA-binding transcriptional LysR family regulator